jgi:hypothetical protein
VPGPWPPNVQLQILNPGFKKAVVKNISFVYPKKATKKVEFGLGNGHFRRYLDTLNVQNFEHANHAGAS